MLANPAQNAYIIVHTSFNNYPLPSEIAMSKTRVFCSFDFDNDKKIKDALILQSKLDDSPFEISDWSLKEAAPEPTWEEEAEKKIKRSDVVVILLGTKTHSASGVKKEAKMARDNDIRIFQLQPKDESNEPVKDGGRVYNWTWENLKKLLGKELSS